MKSYQPRVMLVTGGAGFIGAHFVREALNADPLLQIVNVDKLTYAGSLNNLADLPHAERHHFIQGDILDAKLMQHLMLHHKIDTIVHFAAESHVDRSITSPKDFVETNVLGTFVLLEAARKLWLETEKRNSDHCRFHHISTDEVYGSLTPDAPLFTEKTPYQPRSPYSASKAGSDHLVQAYYHTYGLPITVSHCSNNYGPYQHTEKFIPTVIRACRNEQRIPIYGNGKNIRDWLYVTDHCEGILAILARGKVGETYNLGGLNEWENLSLVNLICSLMDKRLPRAEPYANLIDFVKDRAGHDFRYAIDINKIQTELGWLPKETLESGLVKTLDFYLQE